MFFPNYYQILSLIELFFIWANWICYAVRFTVLYLVLAAKTNSSLGIYCLKKIIIAVVNVVTVVAAVAAIAVIVVTKLAFTDFMKLSLA